MQGRGSTSDADLGYASGPRSRQDSLCDVCVDIDFHRYLDENIDGSINLGSWSSIRRSSDCPFCRLVTHSLLSNPLLTPRYPDAQIILSNELSWKLGIELSPYDRSKSESYSNKFDLRSKAKQCPNDAYRFVVSVEDKDGVSQKARGYIQYLAYMGTDDDERQFFGRRVDAKRVDIDLLQDWLNRCSRWHGDECKTERWTRERLPSSLRLIDVEEKCIVKAPKHQIPRYVALSYVWGTDEMKRKTGMEPAMLYRKNIGRAGDREFTSLPTRIPRTVQDAITLTRWLGYRYLWVDALCIVQDDPPEQKILHLTRMKGIYTLASLTIAAATGSHADHGLPGMSLPRQNVQYLERLDGLRLATMFPSFSELENSSRLIWNTRGWTFQEKLLSQRILLFTDFQVYFKCSESIWTEEVMMETERLSKSVEARRRKYRWQPTREPHIADGRALKLKNYNPQLHVEDDWNYLGGLLDYTTAIQEFTRRTLTDQKDMLFAIDGVLETMEGVTGRFLSGLPEKHFLESLLWYPKLGSIHHYDSRNKIPSWTWASSRFEGDGVVFDLMDVRQLRALMRTSIRSFSSKNKMPGDDSENASPISPVMLLGTYGNLFASLALPLFHKDHTITKIYHVPDDSKVRLIKFDLPISAFDFQDPKEGGLMQSLIKRAEQYAKASNRDWKPSLELAPENKDVLFFQTVLVKFRVGSSLYRKITNHDDEAGIFELLNLEGQCVGEVRLTHGRARRQRAAEDFITISWGLSLQHGNVHEDYIPTWAFNSRPKSTHWFWREWNKLSEMALDHIFFADHGYAPIAQFVVQKWGHFLPKSLKLDIEAREEWSTASQLFLEVHGAEKGQARPRSLWPVVNLILVDLNGGVARRVGVGKVIMKAWLESWNPLREVIFA